MKISVIIPSYKPQEYLWECLDSLRNQTFPKEDFEIILVLNGCKEPYYTQIQTYINTHLKDYNVNFIQTEHGGVSNARNIALDNAQGEYITFIDDDDYVSPTYLEELYDNYSPGIVPITNVLAFNEGETGYLDYYISNLFNKVHGMDKCKLMQARSYMSMPVAKLFHRNDIGNRRFNKKFKIGEDGLFVLSISDKFTYLKPTSPNAIYYRRYRPNSAITSNKSRFDGFNNKLKLFFAYIPFVLQPWRYNFIFCLSRFAAILKPAARKNT